MPPLRAFPWERAASVHARRSASARRAAAPALPSPLHPLPTGQHASTCTPCPTPLTCTPCPAPPASHPLPHTHPSLCALHHRTQFKTRGRGSGKAGAHQVFGLSVVKCCSMCLTLQHFSKLGKNGPRLVAGVGVTQRVSAATSLPVPGHPREGCSRCSPFGDAAPFLGMLFHSRCSLHPCLAPALASPAALAALLWQRLPGSRPKWIPYHEQHLPPTPLLHRLSWRSPCPCQPLPSRPQGPCGRVGTGPLSHPARAPRRCPQGPLEHHGEARQAPAGGVPEGCRPLGSAPGRRGEGLRVSGAEWRGEQRVWMKMGIKRGFAACAVPGQSNRHRSPELSIWYLSPALKLN